MPCICTSPLTSARAVACGRSAASGCSSIRRNTRSAADAADCSSLMMLAISLIGPENRREYSTKDERLPSETLPTRYRSEPKMLIKVSEMLLIKLTDGPTVLP